MSETLLERPRLALSRPLTPTERRVLLHLAHGLKYDEICAAEGISERNVLEPCLARLYPLLGARSHAQAVAHAHVLGLLPWERFPRPLLTGKQGVLLRLIVGGLKNAEIAVEFGVALKTVGKLTHALYRDMGVRNRPHAVHVGVCTGLVDLDGLAVADAS